MSSGARTPERRDPGATREALLVAGSALFAEAGFAGVRVEAVARRAGVNKAMINYHFGGKEGLYRAVLESTFEAVGERLDRLDRTLGAERQLRELVRAVAEVATHRRPNFPAILLREALDASGRHHETIFPLLVRLVSTLREILRQGAREGSLRPVDPLLTHMSLIGGLAFFFATAPARERAMAEGRLPRWMRPPSSQAYVRHVEELMTRGLLAARS